MATNDSAVPPRGRPAATTRETIEEAACELFLEQGYESTSVSDIARRAGVSRSSFFNYFGGKTDVLWGPVLRELASADERFDEAVEQAAVVARAAGDPGGAAESGAAGDSETGEAEGAARAASNDARNVNLAAVTRAAAIELARGADATCIPLAAAQADVMGTERALVETGAMLLLEHSTWLRDRLERLDPAGDPLAHAALASAAVGGVAAAGVAWMRAGTDRGALAPYVERALAGLPAEHRG